MRNYCIECEQEERFSEDGYCLGCGYHADNVIPASYKDDLSWDRGDERNDFEREETLRNEEHARREERKRKNY